MDMHVNRRSISIVNVYDEDTCTMSYIILIINLDGWLISLKGSYNNVYTHDQS